MKIVSKEWQEITEENEKEKREAKAKAEERKFCIIGSSCFFALMEQRFSYGLR